MTHGFRGVHGTGTMRTISTSRLTRAFMVLVGLLLGSGHLTVASICLHDDGASHSKVRIAGCCHCSDTGEYENPNHGQNAEEHEHCADLEVPADFIRGCFSAHSPREHSSSDSSISTPCLTNALTVSVENSISSDPNRQFPLSRQIPSILSSTILIC